MLSGGADFGGGVWDLLASGRRKAAQRDLVARAIGPVWEANHVWLILAVVLLFTCFPAAFARLAVTLNLPLTGVLVGIVLRGSAFAFRGYGGDRDVVQRRWGRVFAVASLVTPVLLGVAVGAVASGAVGEGGRGDGDGFVANYVAPWLAPFPLAVGLFTLCCFAFLAAVYLTLEAPEGELREDFRRRALIAGVAVGVAAGLALLVARPGAPLMRHGLLGSAWAVPFQVATGLAAVSAFATLWTRRYRAGARRRGAAGVAHPLGMGGESVSLRDPARSDDRGRGRAAGDAAPRAARTGARCGGARAFARLSLSSIQSERSAISHQPSVAQPPHDPPGGDAAGDESQHHPEGAEQLIPEHADERPHDEADQRLE